MAPCCLLHTRLVCAYLADHICYMFALILVLLNPKFKAYGTAQDAVIRAWAWHRQGCSLHDRYSLMPWPFNNSAAPIISSARTQAVWYEQRTSRAQRQRSEGRLGPGPADAAVASQCRYSESKPPRRRDFTAAVKLVKFLINKRHSTACLVTDDHPTEIPFFFINQFLKRERCSLVYSCFPRFVSANINTMM